MSATPRPRKSKKNSTRSLIERRDNTLEPVKLNLWQELRDKLKAKYQSEGELNIAKIDLAWHDLCKTKKIRHQKLPDEQTLRNFIKEEPKPRKYWFIDGLCQLLLSCSLEEWKEQQKQAQDKPQQSPSPEEKALALDLAAQALDLIQNQPVHWLPSGVRLAVESMQLHHCWQNDRVLRQGLALLPRPIATLPHEGGVKAIAFSPDGKYLATASEDYATRLWEWETKSDKPFKMQHDTKDVSAIAFSPDQEYLVTVSNDERGQGSTVWVREAASSQIINFGKCKTHVKAIAFSPDSRYLATAIHTQDGAAEVLQVINGQLKPYKYIKNENLVMAVAFSPDGKCLAIAGGNQVTLLWETGSEGISHIEHESVWTITFSPNGNYLATAGADNIARVWNVNTGREIARIPHDDILWAVAFSPDGRYFATAGRSRTAHVWEVASEQEVARMIHDYLVYDVAFSAAADGRYIIATASDDQTAQVWELESVPEVGSRTKGTVKALAFSPDGTYLATISEDGTLQVWEMSTGKQVLCIPYEQPVKVAFSQDGEYIAVVSKGNTASIWKWKEIDSRPVKLMPHGQNTVQIQDIAFSPLGDYVATASKDGTVKLWEFPSSNEAIDLLHEGAVESVAFSPDGKLLTAGSLNGVILVWEVSTGKIVKRLAHTTADCSANH